MTGERWEQVKAIFHDAVEWDPASRAELLRERCGSDEELVREVESLLASDGQTIVPILEDPAMQAAVAAAVAPAKSEAMPVLRDRYELERELGRGGMSVVYVSRDRQLLGKRVVVKVLLEEASQDPWIRQKFQQELEALARIDHPGVVGVLDTGLTAEGKQFLVMQYIEGATLRSSVEPGGMPFARAAGLIRQIGKALAAAHEKGVWHRDLKPENVMLQRQGSEEHVKLIDFGIAGIQNSQFTGEMTKVAGSSTYMAPEQFAGNACAASDTYALGVVAWELLTGQSPFDRGSLVHLVAEDKTRLAALRTLRPDLPAAAERSILKAMSFRPEARHAGISEFSEELYRALTAREPARKTGVSGAPEIAHILFADLVSYSLLPMDQQREYLGEFQQVVRDSPLFRAAEAAGDLISLPTGDGMALVFFGDPTAPAQCALEVASGLKNRPHLQLRMGVHSGPVYRVADVNANGNVSGGGINMAQRVMDCGGPGHILLSRNVAEVLEQLSDWRGCLQDLGVYEVKHGVKVHLFNLCKDGLGNPAIPPKIRHGATPPAAAASAGKATGAVIQPKKWLAAAAVIIVLIIVAGLIWRQQASRVPPVTNPASAILPERSLHYYVMVQKWRDGKPYQQPFRLSGERLFEADYRIRLNLSSPETGYLYVLNEGPESTSEKPDLHTLFPSPAISNGSARLDPGQEVNIPSASRWIVFDAQKGKEKLWLLWSSAPVAEFEVLKKYVNVRDRGTVGDAGEARTALTLLNQYSAKVDAEPDETTQSTILKARRDVFARLIPLEHD